MPKTGNKTGSKTGSKIGRNDPCHCGSGKKLKRCCGDKVSASPVRPPARAPALSPARGGGGSPVHVSFSGSDFEGGGDGWMPRSAYHLSKIRSAPELLEMFRAQAPDVVDHLWTMPRVAALSTEEIVEYLAERGIDGSKAAFCEAAKGIHSGWAVSETWQAQGAEVFGEEERLGLMAVELWKRYLPERTCLEQVDDWFDEGLDLRAPDSLDAVRAACDVWGRAWAALRTMLAPDVFHFEQVDKLFPERPESFADWCEGYREALKRLVAEPPYAEAGADFCVELLERFLGMTDVQRFLIQRDQLTFLVRGGQRGRAEAFVRAIINDEPDRARGYCYLAEILSQPVGRRPTRAELQEALATLERATTLVTDARIWGAHERIEEIRGQLISYDVVPPSRESYLEQGPQ